MKKVGIYAGTFDPVHAGHLAFATAAAQAAGLESVYFLPERHPRNKPSVSPYDERVRLLREVLPDPSRVLSLPDGYFSTASTLPAIKRIFPNHHIVLLIGSDVAAHLHSWPHIEQLVDACEFIVGIRKGYDIAQTQAVLNSIDNIRYSLIATEHAHVSSTQIRQNTN